MNSKRGSALIATVAWVLMLAGCGSEGGKGTPPTIAGLQLGAATVAPGAQLTGQVLVADPDGLAGLKLALRLADATQSQPEQTVAVANATDAITDAPVPFVLLIAAQAPVGSTTLTVAAIDGDGERSNELTASFEVQ